MVRLIRGICLWLVLDWSKNCYLPVRRFFFFSTAPFASGHVRCYLYFTIVCVRFAGVLGLFEIHPEYRSLSSVRVFFLFRKRTTQMPVPLFLPGSSISLLSCNITDAMVFTSRLIIIAICFLLVRHGFLLLWLIGARDLLTVFDVVPGFLYHFG